MRQPVLISFRDQTTGKLNDFLIDEQRACAASQNLLGYLAGALLNYKDEGVEFSPTVILCDALESVLKTFPGAIFHEIGHAALDPTSGPKILKDCGPLTSRNWFIFIERNSDRVRYGVFTYFRRPTAIPLHEGITINPGEFCALIRKTSANTIEVRGAKGSNLSLIFSTVREAVSSTTPIETFAAACCGSISEINGDADFKQYFARLLERALADSHGTILVIADKFDLDSMPQIRDAVLVAPALNFYSAFLEFHTSNTADSILHLQRCEELLEGFLRCDGMIVFDTSGSVLAYRVFFQPVAIGESAEAVPREVVGGARRRAFEGVKELVGDKLVAALFRSQDGLTLYHGVQR